MCSAADFVTGLSFKGAKQFKISVVPERISVPFYRLSGNDLVMKLCPKLSFRCLPLSSSVFLKVCKDVDLQLVYSISPFPAFLTYFFMKKIKGLRRIFDGSRLFRLILEFMDVGMRNTVCRLIARTGLSIGSEFLFLWFKTDVSGNFG